MDYGLISKKRRGSLTRDWRRGMERSEPMDLDSMAQIRTRREREKAGGRNSGQAAALPWMAVRSSPVVSKRAYGPRLGSGKAWEC
jgi:hypothetical protein